MRAVLLGAMLLATHVLSHPKVQNPVSPERKAELMLDVKAKVRGIALPLLTLYHEDGTVDHESMTAYVKEMMADGLVEGKGFILTAASGGDFPVLSVEERKAIAKNVMDATEGKVPIFLSVQDTHLPTSIELAQYAESIGCYGIQVSVPFYWTTTDGDALAWFEAIHNATKKVIIIMYNTPWENYDAPVEILQELAKLERVRALKFYTDRAPQTFRWAQTMVQLRDDFAIIDNTLNPVQHHILGGTAFISHLASVWPKHELQMNELLWQGNYTGALKMWEGGLLPWYDFRIKMGDYTSGESPPVKAALELTGRAKSGGSFRLPSRALTPELREELRQLLVKLGVPGVQSTPVSQSEQKSTGALTYPKVQNPVSPGRKAELMLDVKAKVRGIALPLLTLYHEDGTVDHESMTAYVKEMMADGLVEGKGFILTAASGGDFPVLSVEERKAIAKNVMDATEGKVPIFLSVQDTHLPTSIELAQYAESIGCYGIQVSVPFYWTTTDGDALAWFEAIHNATKKVIIIMYNTPWESYDAPVEILQELAKLERVRALKYYTDRKPQTFRWAQTMVQLRDDFAIIDNTLNPVQHHMLGGTAFISHLASVWPKHELQMNELLWEGNYTGALKMWEGGLLPWYDFRIKMGAYTSGESPPVKAALELTGRAKSGGSFRLPSRALTPELREELRQLLVKLGVPGVKGASDTPMCPFERKITFGTCQCGISGGWCKVNQMCHMANEGRTVCVDAPEDDLQIQV